MLLESMKKGVGKIVMWVLGVLLIASFAVWGIGDMTGSISNPDGVAKVADTRITQREFQEQFRREMNRIRERIGDIDIQQARSLGLVESTLNGMISRRLLAQQASDLGLLIGDEQIRAKIQAEAAFRNELGQFDRALFQSVLANSGLSEGAYVASLRQDMQQDYLAAAISSGVSAPLPLAEAVFRFRNERRSAEVIRVPRTSVDAAPKPTDAQLATYLEENADAFMAAEYRSVTLLYLNPDEVAKELSPAPERVREEYEYRLSSLSVPERRQIEQILLKDEDAAKKTHAALSEGRSFVAVAQEAVGKSADEIKLGVVAKTDLLPDLADATFALSQGGFTAPIRSPLGWHIIRVAEIQPGRQPELKEVEKDIAAELARELALDDLVKRANRIEDTLAGGGSIEEAALDVGVRVRKIEPMDPAAKLQAGTPVADLPKDPTFIETVFATDKGATSRLIETTGGGYFMVRVDDVIASAKRSLDQVRDAVENAWKIDQLDAVAKKAAEEIRDAAKSGKAMTQIATERRLVVDTGKPVSRFATGEEATVPRALIADLFKAEKGGIVMGPTAEGYAVARLAEIIAAGEPSGDADYERLKDTLASAFATDLLQQYTQALRQEYPVSISGAALEAFFASQQR